MRAAQQLRDDVAEERAAFAAWQATADAGRVVCVDESGVVAGMRCAYGYARRGERCVEHAPYRKGRRTSLIGWVRASGGAVVAVEGAVTRGVFTRFVAEHLAPALRPGDLVVWDNHSIHGGAEVRALIEGRGAALHPQPRYTPEANAAEPLWSKVKGHVRRARADTAEGLAAALRSAVSSVTAADAVGWLRHCGYRINPTA